MTVVRPVFPPEHLYIPVEVPEVPEQYTFRESAALNVELYRVIGEVQARFKALRMWRKEQMERQ